MPNPINFGCLNTRIKSVSVNVIPMPNITTPSNGTMADRIGLNTSGKNTAKIDIAMAPNGNNVTVLFINEYV